MFRRSARMFRNSASMIRSSASMTREFACYDPRIRVLITRNSACIYPRFCWLLFVICIGMPPSAFQCRISTNAPIKFPTGGTSHTTGGQPCEVWWYQRSNPPSPTCCMHPVGALNGPRLSISMLNSTNERNLLKNAYFDPRSIRMP